MLEIRLRDAFRTSACHSELKTYRFQVQRVTKMFLEAFAERQEPVPLILHGSEVDLDHMYGGMALIQQCSSLVVYIIVLLLT